MVFYGNDNVEDAAARCSSMLADEFYSQNNLDKEEDDESWYELQETLRERILKAAKEVFDEFE